MELVFIFSVSLIEMFWLHFFKVMEIVRAFWVYALMQDKELPVFLSNKGVTTVRAGETNGYSDDVSRAESLSTNLALILPVTAIIIVNKVVRSST